MATRLLLNYSATDDNEVRGVERLVDAPAGTHANAVMLEEVIESLRGAGAHAEADRLLAQAQGTPVGEVLRLFREGLGRLTETGAEVIRAFGYDPSFGGTRDTMRAAAIVAAQGGTLEHVRAIYEHRLGLTWG